MNAELEPSPRATRIVCTLGPASSSPQTIEELVRAGMDVARLNFSHGTREGHRRAAELVREAAGKLGRSVAVLQDLQGHKVRTGRVAGDGRVALEPGRTVALGLGDAVTGERIGIDYEGVARHVAPGHHVYLDDGTIELEVTAVDGDDLVCGVVDEGELGSRKGVIFPDASLPFPAVNPRDLEDARFGVELAVDMLAMSFVRRGDEVREMRSRLEAWGAGGSFIVAKVEDASGVENIDGILEAADAVLIARGDLGVTLPRERVPGIQKLILQRANARGVPVITATQMLESMTRRDTPTRAEVSDVHGAVTSGSDAVMLSAETATGLHPTVAVREMDRICRAAEEEAPGGAAVPSVQGKEGLRDRMAEAAVKLTESVGARAVLAFSLSGSTLRALSAARCPVPVHGVVADSRVLRQLLLHRGLSLLTMPRAERLDDLVEPLLERVLRQGIARPGERVVVVAGQVEPDGRRSHLLKVHEL